MGLFGVYFLVKGGYNMNSQLGMKIKQLRKANHMTQQQLADKSNLSINSIRRYESGERSPSLQAIQSIALALNTDVNSLVDKTTIDAISGLIEHIHNPALEAMQSILSTVETISTVGYSDIGLRVLTALQLLNKKGQEKVCQYAEDLSHIDKYRNRTGDSKEAISPGSDSDK